jgi:hypothetical protein
MKKFTYKYVYKYFKSHDCELLEDKYIDCHTKMKYRCFCGNISYITFISFQQRHRCKKCGMKKLSDSRKHSYKYVKNYFKKQGCKLKSKTYEGCDKPLDYTCNCGNDSIITFASFKRGSRCKQCGIEKNKKQFKHPYEYVKTYFEKQGCKLKSKTYENFEKPLKYTCSCGNDSVITFASFKNGCRCMKCSGKEKFTYEYVKNYFKEQGCELREDTYEGANEKIEYKCNCENISTTTFNRFKRGGRCMKCSGEKSGKHLKHSYEYVKTYFEKHGCELKETKYKNYEQQLEFKCTCGDIDIKTFHSFQKIPNCRNCSREKRRKTMIEKYGVPYFVSGAGYSKESQILFDAICKKIENQYKEKVYYATLNKEFGVNYNGKWFNYDFVNSKYKKVIEYNGRIFHPIPSLKDADTGWFPFDKNKTAREAREYEKVKYNAIKKQGYKILTVWDYEFHSNFNNLVQKCINFLTD